MEFSVRRDLWKDYWVLRQGRYFSQGLSNASRRGVMSGRGLVLSTNYQVLKSFVGRRNALPVALMMRPSRRWYCQLMHKLGLRHFIFSHSNRSLLTKNGIELSWMHMPAYFTQWSFRSAYLPFLESKLGRGISFPWCVNSKMAASPQVTKSVHFLLLKSWLLSRTVTRS